MHESKLFIEVIEVIVFTFAGNAAQFQEPGGVLYWLERLASFHDR